jgi:hypothetical protein
MPEKCIYGQAWCLFMLINDSGTIRALLMGKVDKPNRGTSKAPASAYTVADVVGGKVEESFKKDLTEGEYAALQMFYPYTIAGLPEFKKIAVPDAYILEYAKHCNTFSADRSGNANITFRELYKEMCRGFVAGPIPAIATLDPF